MSDGNNSRSSHFRCSSAGAAAPLSISTFDEFEWHRLKSENSKDGKSIPYLHLENVSYDEFFNAYLLKNLPCMFSQSLTKSWLSRRCWKGIDGETVNYEFLLNIYGDVSVSAVNCNDSDYKEGYGTRDCRDMTFRDYVGYLRTHATDTNEQSTCLYLKDWHIVRTHRTFQADGKQENLLPYECPMYFQSDWLNEFCEDRDTDDYKFCYMGPKGTFTSFHSDVYGSYSWSANIIGVKKWYLYPPGKEMRFYDNRLKKLSFRWHDPGVCGEDYMEVIQNAGECIFVPSGWHHVVWNMTDAVSINHNWFNGSNICYIWSVLEKALKEVQEELYDFRTIPEFHEQCQLVLKANHGLNYEGFFELLTHIKNKRLKILNCSKEEDPAEEVTPLSKWHAEFDMEVISHVIKEHCIQDPIVQKHFFGFIQILASS